METLSSPLSIIVDQLTDSLKYKNGYIFLEKEKLSVIDFFNKAKQIIHEVNEPEIIELINRKVKKIYLIHQNENSILSGLANRFFSSSQPSIIEVKDACTKCLEEAERIAGEQRKEIIKKIPLYKQMGRPNLAIKLSSKTIPFTILVHKNLIMEKSALFRELLDGSFGQILGEDNDSKVKIPQTPVDALFTDQEIYGVSITALLTLVEYFYSNQWHFHKEDLMEIARAASYLQYPLRNIHLSDVVALLNSEFRHCVWEYALELVKYPLEKPGSPDALHQYDLLDFIAVNAKEGPEKARALNLLGQSCLQYSAKYNAVELIDEGIELLKIAAEGNDADAMWELYKYYDQAKPRDQFEVDTWLSQAIACNHPSAIYELAIMHRKKKNFSEAEKFFLLAEKLGDPKASNHLGLMFENDLKDYKKALEHYEIGAARGNKYCYYNAGKMYEEGRGVARNLFTASMCYTKSQELGCSEAVEKVRSLIKTYHLDNLNLKDPQSICTIGNQFKKGIADLKKDLSQAENFYLGALEKGSAEAAFRLAEMCEDGSPVKDLKKALFYYKKASKMGNTSALIKLGKFFENGFGMDIKLYKALKYYRRAAESGLNKFANEKILNILNELAEGGDFDAMWELFLFFSEENLNKEAEAWLEKAAANDHPLALNTMPILQRAKENDVDAMRQLFLLFTEKNQKKEAQRWLKLAVDNNHSIF